MTSAVGAFSDSVDIDSEATTEVRTMGRDRNLHPVKCLVFLVPVCQFAQLEKVSGGRAQQLSNGSGEVRLSALRRCADARTAME